MTESPLVGSEATPSTSITIERVEDDRPVEQHNHVVVEMRKLGMDLCPVDETNSHFTVDEPSPSPRKITRRLQTKKLIEDSMRDHGVIRLRVDNLAGVESPEMLSPFKIKLELDKKQMRRNLLNQRRALVFYHVARFHHKFGIRHVVLVFLLALYSVMGGVLFLKLEASTEVRQLHENKEKLTELIDNLTVAIYEIADVELTPQNAELTSLLIREYYREMLTTEGKYSGSVFHKFERIDQRLTWNYGTSIFYAMTLFTTIGYGTIACQTVAGKAMSIIYATIGLPLMLVVLSDVGRLMLKWLTKGYNSCLRLFWYLRHAFAKHAHIFKQYAVRNTDSEQAIKEEDFPLELALSISVGYLMLCAVVVEFFDYHDGITPGLSFGNSFYFAFVSMSTIGLGDVMPNNIEYSPFLALMFLFGLSLVGVVNSAVYVKMENRFLNGVDQVENFFEKLYVNRHGKEGYDVMRNLGPCIQLFVIALPLFDDQEENNVIRYLSEDTVGRNDSHHARRTTKPPRRAMPLGIFGLFQPRITRPRSSTIAASDGKHQPIAENCLEASIKPDSPVRRVYSDRVRPTPPTPTQQERYGKRKSTVWY